MSEGVGKARAGRNLQDQFQQIDARQHAHDLGA